MINYVILCVDQKKRKQSMPIPDDESLANLIAAIAGGIEAPIQFILQVNSVLNCNLLLLCYFGLILYSNICVKRNLFCLYTH